MSEFDADEREAREAAALRRAIDEAVAEEQLPREALEAAALLRYGARGAELDPAASRRILEELTAARPRAVDTAWWRKIFAGFARRWWIAPLAPVAAAVVGLVFWVGPVAVPEPPISLLRAQAAVAAADDSAVAVLEQEMRAYRRAVLSEVGR